MISLFSLFKAILLGALIDSAFSIKDIFTGHYFGIDMDDGTIQQMQIVIKNKKKRTYDILMRDSSYSTCSSTTGLVRATDVRLPNLSFDLPLYCAPVKNGDVDFTATPDAILAGGFFILEKGRILRRPNGYIYFKG